MPALDHLIITTHLATGNSAPTTTGKGKALEDLACYLFGSVPGVTVTHRNELNIFATEEVDVAIWIDDAAGGLNFLPSPLLIECKNWSNAVSSIEVAWFDTKLRHKGLEFGILLAMNGVTGNAGERTNAHAIISAALADKRRIIVITELEIRALTHTDDLVLLIKKKICDLVLKQTCI